MVEAQIDAFVCTSKVEYLSLVSRVDPTSLCPGDWQRIVVLLTTPALHEVLALDGCEVVFHRNRMILTRFFCHGRREGLSMNMDPVPAIFLNIPLFLAWVC